MTTPDVRELAIGALDGVLDRWLLSGDNSGEMLADAVLAVATPVIEEQAAKKERAKVAEELRAVAAGRGEYLPNEDALWQAVHAADSHALIAAEVDALDQAARIVEGDTAPLYSLLPSWRWSDEMNAELDAARAASHSTQPETGQDHG